MNKRLLIVRSIVAVLLLIGFYALALGIAAGLLWVVYAQVFIAHRVIIKLALVCVVLAGVILWSILPRIDRFEPPGPLLSERDHPRLFALIADIARRTNQAMPSAVYLVADVNAFVAQRGGFMGFFSRRVMGIGLPLLSLLSVAQLRAVIAHEFGHYHGGDTMLGPWIYKTRNAIGRTIISLAEGGSHIVRKPFEWYGTMFLRITHGISRAQELAADELAARVVGAKHLIDGLKAVHGGGAAYGAFLEHEYAPVLAAGYRPPLAHGFRAFVDQKRVKSSLEELVAKELEQAEHDPFDTHPPLAQRIAAVAHLEHLEHDTEDAPAIELLGDADLAEADLVRGDQSKPLARLAWSQVAERVLLPQWRQQAEDVARQLGPVTLAELVRPPAQLGKLAAKVLKQDLSEEPDAASRIGAHLVAAAACSTLVHAGWSVKNRVGRPIALRKGELRLTPFKDFGALVSGKLKAAELLKRLSDAGVQDLALQATTNSQKDGPAA